MALCKYREQEMNGADGCVSLPVKTVDGDMESIPYGSETKRQTPAPGQQHHGVLIGDPPRCHDCGVLPGRYHHVGCDWEECPRCHEQLIGCDCDPDAIPSSEPEEKHADQN
jgi:hypothetical protein